MTPHTHSVVTTVDVDDYHVTFTITRDFVANGESDITISDPISVTHLENGATVDWCALDVEQRGRITDTCWQAAYDELHAAIDRAREPED